MHPQRKSLDALTGLRFVAAVGVIVYHYGASAFPAFLRQLVATGFVGVDLFYLLSGFVLTYVYRPPTPLSVREFLAARVARVYPLYALGLVLAAPAFVAALFEQRSAIGALTRLGTALALRLGLVHAWVMHVGVWNVPDWSVSVEWAFYVAFPLLLRWAFRARSPARVGALVWVAGVAVAFAEHFSRPAFVGIARTAPDYVAGVLEYQPLGRFHEFIIGILLARVWLSREEPRHERARAWVSPLVLVALLTLLAFGPALPLLPVSNGVLVPAFAWLVFDLADGRGPLARILASRWLVKLGDASYGAYILHWPLWSLTRPLRSALEPRGAPLVFFVYLAIVVVASLVAFEWVERPLRGALRVRLAGSPRAT